MKDNEFYRVADDMTPTAKLDKKPKMTELPTLAPPPAPKQTKKKDKNRTLLMRFAACVATVAIAATVQTTPTQATPDPVTPAVNDTNWLYTDNTDGTVTLTGYVGEPIGELELPQTLDGKQVTVLGDYALIDCKNLTKVVLPQGLKKIGFSSFYCCEALTSIEIPASVEEIGDRAFSGCETLTSIEIPASVKEIGESPFFNCYELKEIRVAQDNADYASYDGVLYKKTVEGLELVRYPEGKDGERYEVLANTVKIAANAFSTSKLTDIQLPNGLKSIEIDAFSGCSALTSIEIPASVNEIGSNPFCYCPELKEIRVAQDNADFASYDGVLYRKTAQGLELIRYPIAKAETVYQVLPNTVTMDCEAFDYCNLTTVYLPDSLQAVAYSMFWNTDKLTDVYYPGTVEQWTAIAGSDVELDWPAQITIHCTDGDIQ
jgi:hypothetical protein